MFPVPYVKRHMKQKRKWASELNKALHITFATIIVNAYVGLLFQNPIEKSGWYTQATLFNATSIKKFIPLFYFDAHFVHIHPPCIGRNQFVMHAFCDGSLCILRAILNNNSRSTRPHTNKLHLSLCKLCKNYFPVLWAPFHLSFCGAHQPITVTKYILIQCCWPFKILKQYRSQCDPTVVVFVLYCKCSNFFALFYRAFIVTYGCHCFKKTV